MAADLPGDSGENIAPVVLCGGGGTRLWPLSRKHRPKPFLPLLGERSLFEQTLARFGDRSRYASAVVVAGAAHVEAVERSAGAQDAALIVEPCARNTAPAIALAAHRMAREQVMAVCPSDHFIGDEAAFHQALEAAAALARQGYLVALGIAPDRPETGYGYIKRGAPLLAGFAVERFVEKPDAARARQFLASGDYAWNGGIFVFRAGDYLDELARHRPRMAELVERAVERGRSEGARFSPEAEAFAAIEGESIDYAVMENTARAAMVPANMRWSDIGTWPALHEALVDRAEESDGVDADLSNCVRGRAELVDCARVLAFSDGPRISAIGLENIAIVVDGEEVLVTSFEGAQRVGRLSGAKEQ